MRVLLIWVCVLALAAYAWRDWFRALCGLILLTAIVEHPDMPKSVMDIQGLNPWNVLFASVALAWLCSRRNEKLVWDMPGYITLLLLLYLGVVLLGVGRTMHNPGLMTDSTVASMVSEYLINTLKWVVPGLMLFDGCRSPRRVRMALFSVLGLYVLLALQVIRWMPPSSATSGAEITARSLKILVNEVGYHRVNLSMILSGGSWAVLASIHAVQTRWRKLAVVGLFLVVAYAQALTAGRMGYVTWGILGLTLCVLRWRRYLLLFPLVPIVIAIALPGTVERMLEGFSATGVPGGGADEYEVTAGRTLIWPYVIDEIADAPAIGHGRQAMRTTGLAFLLLDTLGEEFFHPHNAYLELLLDNGIIGAMIVLPFYGIVVLYAVRLFRDRQRPLCAAVGGAACALVLALLVAAAGSQSFYPREGVVGMWCAIGLMFRMRVASRDFAVGSSRFAAPRRTAPFPAGEVAAGDPSYMQTRGRRP